ncbi:MAG: aminopeptidase N [Micromonosporaceae bacterium]
MSGARNLRQAEAAERARLLNVSTYDIVLDVTDGAGGAGSGSFHSTTEIHFSCAEPGAETFLEAGAASIRSATLNGKPVDTTGWSADEGLRLTGLAAENTLVLDADFPYCPTEQGLHRAVDPADGEVYLYTQFETSDAQRVFACFDQPDLKARFTWHVTVPAGWRAVSTMAIERDEPGPEGSRIVHFAQTPPMSTYINVLCAGPYHEVRRTHDGIDLGLFCRASLAPHLDADQLFDVTAQGLDFFQANFSVPYPLNKYDHVFVPEFSGAMENLGCVTFADHQGLFRDAPSEAQLAFRAMVLLHEMAHMWFGDLVTMRWWGDVWLNESFATWAAAWALSANRRFGEVAWSAFLGEWKAEGYEGDQLSSTHPVSTDVADIEAVSVNFDRITYGKGAAVLKQIVAYVGAEAFATGLHTYFARHAWGNATLDDLLGALQAASGKPVREFAAQWLRTAQVNTLRADVEVDQDGRYAAVAVRQEAPPEHPTLRTHRMAIGLFDRQGDALVRRDRVELEVSGARTAVPELTGVRAADLLLLNDDDLTYAKVRLDERSTRTVLDDLASLTDPLARALCWAMVWDMVRDAEIPVRQYLPLVTTAQAKESSANLVRTTLGHAEAALTFYADPEWAPVGWQCLADAARATAQNRSASQRTWAKAFARAARSEADLSTVAGWLRGEAVPDGLEIKADLRWDMLQALVAGGAVGPAEIEAEARADPTTNGENGAAMARALIPTAEAKAAAWSLLSDPATKMNVRRVVALCLQHPAQTALTAPFVEPYFERLDQVWREWEFLSARIFASLAYPSHQVSSQLLERTNRWLAESDPPVPLRRLVGDRRDDLQRAIAARACDAAQHS